jgi:hypothetical protein
MKSKAVFAMILLGTMLMAGCEPVDCLFGLYTNADKTFDEKFVGEWKQTSPMDSDSDKNSRWVFLRDGDSTVYNASLIALGKRGGFVAKSRLVSLGNALFVDFEPDTSSFDDGEMTMPYPVIETHMIGRIWIEKDAVRIHFLSDDWVKKQWKEGKLTLAHAGSSDNPLLIASTADLRKFALEHAEDEEAFSLNYELARLK